MTQSRLIACLALLCLLMNAGPAASQIPTVRVDLAARNFGRDTLPYGQEFFLRGPVAEHVDSVVLSYGLADQLSDTSRGYWRRDTSAVIKETEFWMQVGPLRPDVRYEFSFSVHGKAKGSSRQEYMVSLTSAPSHRRGRRTQWSGTIRDTTLAVKPTPVSDTVVLLGNPTSRFQDHFRPDFGLMRSTRAEYVGVTSNVHFYLAPINPNEDLADLGSDVWGNFTKRMSIFAGLALQELSSEADVDALFEDVGSPVVGVGMRGFMYWPNMPARWRPLLQPLRLNTGIVWFHQEDPNPLVDDKIRKRDWFVSVTADIDLKSILGPFDALF